METIPTPRCEAATREDETYEGKFVYVELEFARQLERELHIAKQALEAIQNFSEDNLAKNTSINALNEINTLSA